MANNNEKMVANSPSRIWRQPIFDMQDFETNKTFQLFEEYRNMLGDRSLHKVSQQAPKNLEYVKRLSRKFEWVRRVQVYDKYLGEQRRIKYESEVEKMGQRHIQASLLGFGQVVEYLVSGGLKHDLNGSNFARTLETLVRIERLARGIPTEIIQTQPAPHQRRIIAARQALDELAIEFPTLSAREMVRIAAQDWKVEESDLEDVLSARILTEKSGSDDDDSDGEE